MNQIDEHIKEALLKKKLEKLEAQAKQVRKELQRRNSYYNYLKSIIEKEESSKKSQTIIIKGATKIEFVEIDDIVCCNADEGYTNVQLINGKVITATKPLTVFEKILKHDFFFRISKSHIINTNYIVTLFKDRNQILLKGDILLNIARRKKVEFIKKLNLSNSIVQVENSNK